VLFDAFEATWAFLHFFRQMAERKMDENVSCVKRDIDKIIALPTNSGTFELFR